MLFFKTRNEARTFKAKSALFKVVDRGASPVFGRRWAVKVLNMK